MDNLSTTLPSVTFKVQYLRDTYVSGCIPHRHVPETSVQRARATPPNLPASLARGPPEVPNTEQLDSPPRDPPSILPTDDQPKSFQRATSGSPSATGKVAKLTRHQCCFSALFNILANL